MKYINADTLKERVTRLIASARQNDWPIAEDYLRRVIDIMDSLQQEQPEVDMDALVNEAFDKYSSVDGYGQLAALFNRAELYSFIKKIAKKLARKEDEK